MPTSILPTTTKPRLKPPKYTHKLQARSTILIQPQYQQFPRQHHTLPRRKQSITKPTTNPLHVQQTPPLKPKNITQRLPRLTPRHQFLQPTTDIHNKNLNKRPTTPNTLHALQQATRHIRLQLPHLAITTENRRERSQHRPQHPHIHNHTISLNTIRPQYNATYITMHPTTTKKSQTLPQQFPKPSHKPHHQRPTYPYYSPTSTHATQLHMHLCKQKTQTTKN